MSLLPLHPQVCSSVSGREAHSTARWDLMGCACISWAVLLSRSGSAKWNSRCTEPSVHIHCMWVYISLSPVDWMLISSWNTQAVLLGVFSGSSSSNRHYSAHICDMMQNLIGQVGAVGRVSPKVPDLETLTALQAWGDLQQLQQLHVVEQIHVDLHERLASVFWHHWAHGRPSLSAYGGYFERFQGTVSTPPKLHGVWFWDLAVLCLPEEHVQSDGEVFP